MYRWSRKLTTTPRQLAGIQAALATGLIFVGAACYDPLYLTTTSTLTLAEAAQRGAIVNVSTEPGNEDAAGSRPALVAGVKRPPESIDTLWLEVDHPFARYAESDFGPTHTPDGEEARPVYPVEPIGCPVVAEELSVTINGVAGEWLRTGTEPTEDVSDEIYACESWRFRFDSGFADDDMLEVRLEDDSDVWEIDIPWPPSIEVTREIERCVHDVEEADEALCEQWEVLFSDDPSYDDAASSVEAGELLRFRYPVPHRRQSDSWFGVKIVDDPIFPTFVRRFDGVVTGDADETRASFIVPTIEDDFFGTMHIGGQMTRAGVRCDGPARCTGLMTDTTDIYLAPLLMQYTNPANADDEVRRSAD